MGAKSRSYQVVTIQGFVPRLETGPFAAIHEKFARADAHLLGNVDVTRLRTYLLCGFSQLALDSTSKGSFLTLGVSFGTTPKIVSEFLNFRKTDRDWWMVDPFDGRGGVNHKYNTSLEAAKSDWDTSIKTHWIQFPLPEACALIDDSFALIHLNTGCFEAELESLQCLISKLERGGLIIMDLYGWMEIEKQRQIDEHLRNLGCNTFVLPTRQLVAWQS